uniref:Rad21/Rec8-like protein N-terminal domain-containing protein n=2 Tax=Parascaris univalens TaxID=6257 RepID=A0A914ZZT7_PARUN
VAFSGEDVNLRFSLHLLSTLCTGIVQLHLKRTELLLHDVEKLNVLLSSKLKEDKQRGDDNAEQLGISDVLSEVGRKGKRKDALTLLNIDTSLIDLSNDLDKMAVDSGLKFGADLNVSDIILEEAHRMERDGNVVDDDLGMITPGQWLILEGVMRHSRADGGEVATNANHLSDDHTREALMIAGAEFAVDKAAEVVQKCLQI